MKRHSTETTSSGGEDTSREEERPLSLLQEAQYSGTAKDFIHLSDESYIELVKKSNAADVVGNELEGVTVVPHKKDPTEGGRTIIQDR